jgi:hypothetical protein
MVATKREKGIFASAAAKSAETKKKLGIDKVSAQKSLATRIKNGTQLRGITHPKAKKYLINSPHGGVYIIHGELEMFCAFVQISYQIMKSHVNRGPVPPQKNHVQLRSVNTIGWEISLMQ